MITYDRLWETMKKKNVTQYQLIKDHHVSKGLLDRLRNNEGLTTRSIEMLCRILDCRVQDIMSYVKDDAPKE